MFFHCCWNLYFLLLFLLQITFLNSKKIVQENEDDFGRSWYILMSVYVEGSKEELTVTNATIKFTEICGIFWIKQDILLLHRIRAKRKLKYNFTPPSQFTD